ncbi:hypothetical protein E3P86_03600 [Wallemia ichthyophaga]|uniref:tRNA ligase n=1 Tax=Wallemia ichthyophaga TaxID=245174 RepID=A0A4T0IJH2_WALIC|nr:hypothetical protein E3P86_03600 [Wallemia ichthyophaga]
MSGFDGLGASDASDASVLAQLHALSLHDKPIVRQNEHTLAHASGTPSVPSTITSWKMNEHQYAKSPSPFPTLARGLFTQGERIIVRGYDKFFNVDEVPWTSWGAIESTTAPPYVLTFKENGCIIFIAALTRSKVVVTSKHALGGPSEQAAAAGVEESHAQVGERWLAAHLQRAHKTEAQLAEVLYDHSWTAVAELCDDSFEEHVLGYAQERSGLHLHGLNSNTAAFSTAPFDVVQGVAETFGFLPTRARSFSSLERVRAFVGSVQSEGGVDGEPIEGFVVRCQNKNNVQLNNTHHSTNSYSHSPFFFKIKFDEPYLMYREWREITRGLLAKHAEGKLGSDEGGVRKSSYPDSVVYRDWVRGLIREQPALFAHFGRSKGVIALRERFLADVQTGELHTKLANVRETWGRKQKSNAQKVKPTKPNRDEREFERTMIVPIAVPGCGKTAVSMALARLYGFGHTQSDDVQTRKTGPTFEKNVAELLKVQTHPDTQSQSHAHSVVIADRNNHMKQHRARLNNLPFEQKPPLGRVRMIALYWPMDVYTLNTVLRVCSERVQHRGARHQSLRPDADGGQTHEDVIVNFINQFEALDGSAELFDHVVELGLEDDLGTATRKAIAGLRDAGVDLKTVTQDRFIEVLDDVAVYDPQYKRPDEQNGLKKKVRSTSPRYFAVGVECRLAELCRGILQGEGQQQERQKAFLNHLVSHDRIANVPHITLLHHKEMESVDETVKEEYEECWNMFSSSAHPIDFKFRVDALVYNERVMALSLSSVSVENPADTRVKSMVERVMEKKVLHITVGTRDATVNPFESKAAVEEWRRGSEQVYASAVQGVELGGRLRGMF